MATLPTGTLTLLFSDIEGSTALLHRLGRRWAEALSAQRIILRAAFEAHDGVEMGTEGDSFFVVFRSARHAVAAAIEAQRGLQAHPWPDGVTLRVRMGIHTGEPQRHEDGYIGEDVHRAARIGSTAGGGQIVLSAATQRLITDLTGVTLRDLGRHRLKDLPGDERLFDVVVAGLITEFPPLRSLGQVTALPTWTTRLIGREREIGKVLELIGDPGCRLVTVTGAGGSGKTRLVTAAAAARQSAHPDGVYFVELTAARDVTSTWFEIAEALDVGDGVTTDLAAAVLDRLADRSVLLVLDNLEQIVGIDAVVSALLGASATIKVLASSRRPVLLIGEREFPLTPLAVPTSSEHETIIKSPAVEMFTRLAQLTRPNFELTRGNSEAVAALCRRLDGLPLALELAAAQSRLLGPSALLSRIDGHLGSAFAAADRPPRQRTLDDVIAWSYGLLGDTDQAIFRLLSVFERGADLDAIAAVAPAGDVDPLEAIGRLAQASVVRIDEGTDGEPRISMLQTIRSFGRARLNETGERAGAQMRHLIWCTNAVEQTVPLLYGPRRTVALDRLGDLDDDVRAALHFALDATAPPDADRLASGHQLLITVTTRYWYRFGNVAEARRWQEQALAAGGNDSEARIGLLFGLGISVLIQSELSPAIDLLTRSLDMSRRLEDNGWQARILNALAVARRQAGDFSESMTMLRQCLAIAQRDGNDEIKSKALGNLSVLYYDLGDFELAAQAAEESMRINDGRGDDWAVAIDRVNFLAATLRTKGAAAALAQLVEWTPAMVAFGETELMIDLVETAGAIAAELGKPRAAAQLLAVADARRITAGMPRTQAETGRVEAWVAAARQGLSEDDWRHTYQSLEADTPDSVARIINSMALPAHIT